MALILEQLTRQQGYHVLFCHGRVEDRDIGQVFDFLIGHRVDGIILVSSSKQAPALIGSYLSRVPIVLQGATDHIGDMGWSVPLILPACIYIIVMEVASVLETVSQTYPEIADSPLFRLFDNAAGRGGEE